MRRTNRAGIFLTMCLLLTAAILLLSEHTASASEVVLPDEYFFVFNGQEREAGTEYEMKTEEVLLNITAGNWDPSDNVEWISSEPDVIALEDTSHGPNFVNLVRMGPGYSTITAVVTHDTNTYSISCLVKINLEFDYQKTGMTTATTTNERILVMNMADEPKRIYLKYVNYIPENETDPVTGSAMLLPVDWESENEGVAVVDENGYVTPVGSGSTRITVTTKTMSAQDRSLQITMRVVVAPSFSMTFGDIENPITKHSGNDRNAFIPVDGVPSNFIIESNAVFATHLKWEVYDLSTGNKLQPVSNKLTYTVSQISGNVSFENVKAGTYEIYAFANPQFSYNTNAPYAYMKIIVPIDFGDINLVMNVGDTYNIVENSNIPSARIFNYIPGNSSIARINATNGVITARSEGTTTITLEYKPTEHLYDNSSVVVEDINIHVTVIDGISISTTQAMMYTSGTLLLHASVTDPSPEIIWTSDAPDIASVDDGLVTALRPGIAHITAQVTIHGIVKKVTCEITVQQSVASITIDPTELNLAMGEYQTLHATISPRLNGISLRWQSSDDSIVRIVEDNPLTVTVQGVAGGHAVISAINADNIVVGYCHVHVRQPVTGITLNETSITLNQNVKSIQLRAIIYPENALNKEVTWTSSNTSVASVNENGLVTLSRPGEVTIIARSVDNPSVMALCNITIEVPVASIGLDDKELILYVGQAQRIGYTVLPINASKSGVQWTSTNTSVATVDTTGKVTAKNVGTTVIIAKTLDGGFTTHCTVFVKQVADGVKFAKPELAMKTGESRQIEYTLVPADSTDAELIWESTDTKIVVVDDSGRATAKGTGTAFIIVRTEAGGMSYCKITVTQPVEGLILNFTDKTIHIGEKFELKVSVTPSEASQMKVTWKSSNLRVATISETGIVEGLTAGTTVITCTTVDGGYSATCVVTVRELVTELKMNYESYRLGIDKSVTLTASSLNETATTQKFLWVSSNEDVATVSQKGKVTGHEYGFATITAIAQDGSDAEATCEVEVVRAVTRVTISKTSLNMLVGDSRELAAKIEPKNATYKGANWSSSDSSVAMVDEDGVVTALQEGTATITADAQDNSGKKAVCIVTVSKRVPSNSIIVMDKKLVLIPGEAKTVQVALNPVNSTDRFTWSTDNSAVAGVDENTGRITANAIGTANVTVMTDSGKTATIIVTVIGLNVTELELEQYSRYRLEVEGATTRVTWDISNPEIADISNGMIISKAKGKATITATVNGRKLTCKLTVVKIK